MEGILGSLITPSEATIAYRFFFTSLVYYSTEAINLTKTQQERINRA